MVFIIYLLSIIEDVKSISSILFILSMIVTGIFIVSTIAIGLSVASTYEADVVSAKKILPILGVFRKWAIIFTCLISIPAVFVPGSKAIAAMYLLPKIVGNQHVQGIGDKALTVLESKLDQWADEITKEKKKD